MSLSTKTYSAGDVIASSQPFVHTLDNVYKKLYCDYCLTAKQNFIQCPYCESMYYCGRDCQSNDLNVHQFECTTFAENIEAINDCYLLKNSYILLRLIIMIKSRPSMTSKKHLLHNGEHNCFDDLMSHQNGVKHDWSEEITELLEFLEVIGIESTFDELSRIVGQYNTNSFGLYGNSDTDYTEIERNAIGSGVYINISVFDHSCQPNAAFINDGINMQIRAMTRIEPYEKITISYIDIETSKIKRRSLLKMNYYFDCHCDKCENNTNKNFNYSKLSNLLKEYEKTKLPQKCYKNITNSEEFREKLENVIDLTEQILNLKKMLHKNNSPDCSNAMYVHSLLQMIAMDCGVSGYTYQNITPFLKSTEDYVKITHGIDHNMYKKFVKTGCYQFNVNHYAKRGYCDQCNRIFFDEHICPKIAVRSDTSDKFTHFHTRVRRQLASKSNTSTSVFLQRFKYYASEHSCQFKRVREDTTERNVKRRANCAEDCIREAFESLDEIPNDHTLQWKVYYGDPNNERSVIVNVSVESMFELINSAAFKAKIREPISLSLILK